MNEITTSVTAPVKDLVLSLGFPVCVCIYLAAERWFFTKRLTECLEKISVSMALINEKLHGSN